MNAAFNMFVKQSIREQSIPSKVTKNTNVQYMDRSLVDKMLDSRINTSLQTFDFSDLSQMVI